jgi:hypothetical protein
MKTTSIVVKCSVRAKPGVMVPCEENIIMAAEILGVKLTRVIPTRNYTMQVSSGDGFKELVQDIYNPAIETVELLSIVENVECNVGDFKADRMPTPLPPGGPNRILLETRGYLLDGPALTRELIEKLTKELLVDAITETCTIRQRTGPGTTG